MSGLGELHRRLGQLERHSAMISQSQTDIHQALEKIVTQLDDAKTAQAEEAKAIKDVLALVSTQTAKITDLQDQLTTALASGADLTPIIDEMKAETATLQAALPTPAPAPAP